MAKKDISDQIAEIMDDYAEHVVETTNKVFGKVARAAVPKLKAGSPKDSGDYAQSWKIKKETGFGSSLKTDSITIYNEKYQLTHLLENGHMIENQYGSYGRKEGQEHIGPVAEWCDGVIPEDITREL